MIVINQPSLTKRQNDGFVVNTTISWFFIINIKTSAKRIDLNIFCYIAVACIPSNSAIFPNNKALILKPYTTLILFSIFRLNIFHTNILHRNIKSNIYLKEIFSRSVLKILKNCLTFLKPEVQSPLNT